MIAIPGPGAVSYLEDNAAVVNLTLTAPELRRLKEVAPRGIAGGSGCPEEMMRFMNL